MRAPSLRYIILGALGLLVVGHFLGQRLSESYALHSSLQHLRDEHLGLGHNSPVSTWSNGKLALQGGPVHEHHRYAAPDPVTDTTRANATFVMVSCPCGLSLARSTTTTPRAS